MSDYSTSILPPAARLLVPVLYGFAIFLLLRGHNLPGGGFIGGLVMGSALVLRVMVQPERTPRVDLIALAGLGLMLALIGAAVPLFMGQEFFTGVWGPEFALPLVGKVKLGTVLVFDIGVFLVVTGVAAKILLVLLAQLLSAQADSAKPARRAR